MTSSYTWLEHNKFSFVTILTTVIISVSINFHDLVIHILQFPQFQSVDSGYRSFDSSSFYYRL